MNPEITITTGSTGDYGALARYHYRAGRPATCVRTLRACEGAELAGVLVVSMPTLNALWRKRAWADWACGASPRDAAAALNERVRTISRVVVDPRWRGLGVAAALVRAYLADPLTTHTEAPAAMGRYCRFFESAGMRAVVGTRARHAVAFGAALRRAGVRPWQLLDLDRAAVVSRSHPALVAAASTWANAGRATRTSLRGASGAERLALAACALAAPRVVYVSP